MIQKRNRILRHLILGLTVLGLISYLTGCGGGLPKEIKKRAKAIPDTIKNTESQIKTHQDKYNNLVSSSDFKPVERFANKEDWNGNFASAQEQIQRANKVYDQDLRPLLKQNKHDQFTQVVKHIVRIKQILADADKLAQYPTLRYTKIQDIIKNVDQFESQAKKNAKQIEDISNNLKTGVLAKALQDFPDLSEKINTRFAPLSDLERKSINDLSIVNNEFSNHVSNKNADYASFLDHPEALVANLNKMTLLEKSFTKDANQLYTSYTKILHDMKEDLFVTIKRESWDNYSDYYNPKFVTFERQVSPETYEVLTADETETIGQITAGWGNPTFKTQLPEIWKTLNINPSEQWPGSGHDSASFWVEGSKEVYYHKYMLEQDGETKETGWEKVDASFYDANLEFLGMAILAKPYGVFESDQLKQAAPPGMAYVGNSQYGEWKNDNDGNQFWSWYGKYAFFSSMFFFPPSYYYYSSWNRWNTGYRSTKPYYGKTKNGFQKYGTYGTSIKKSPRYQSSSFAKSGGLKTRASSVRGAASNLRGGGPKSKGK